MKEPLAFAVTVTVGVTVDVTQGVDMELWLPPAVLEELSEGVPLDMLLLDSVPPGVLLDSVGAALDSVLLLDSVGAALDSVPAGVLLLDSVGVVLDSVLLDSVPLGVVLLDSVLLLLLLA